MHSTDAAGISTALVIMAAGLGSRFGGGIKQLEPVGPNGEIIMDYSIHDAMEAGFDRIVFIIRKDMEQAFERAIGGRIKAVCARRAVRVDYAFQELEDLPEGFSLPEGRSKPWGTGQAVLACRGKLDCPFVVINADDYYGKEAFRLLRAYLLAPHADGALSLCMAGFILRNTLSEHGSVTRGICQVDDNLRLQTVKETKFIVKTADGAGVQDGDRVIPLDADSRVSMNMWGLTPEILPVLEREFGAFLAGMTDPLKDEFLLPTVMDKLLREGQATVQVLETGDKWFGVTYREDKAAVVESFARLVRDGVYATDLYSR